MSKQKKWCLYILECRDNTLYTGITNDLSHRLAMHAAGKGAKYTRGRGPFKLRYCVDCDDHSAALKLELEIKSMSKAEKHYLCADYINNDVEVDSLA